MDEPRYIYFLRAGKRGPVKIGKSTNPAKRLRQHQVGNHEKLRLLAVFPECGKITERYIHTVLAAHHLNGEWFAAAPEVLTFPDMVIFGPPAPSEFRKLLLARATRAHQTQRNCE